MEYSHRSYLGVEKRPTQICLLNPSQQTITVHMKFWWNFTILMPNVNCGTQGRTSMSWLAFVLYSSPLWCAVHWINDFSLKLFIRSAANTDKALPIPDIWFRSKTLLLHQTTPLGLPDSNFNRVRFTRRKKWTLPGQYNYRLLIKIQRNLYNYIYVDKIFSL